MASKFSPKNPQHLRAWADVLGITLLAIVLALVMTTFVMRSYNVVGISMEPTLQTGDLVLTNKLGRTLAQFTGHAYIPKRGELVVFKNPFYNQGDADAFIIKRVIGLPGERIVVRDGRITVYPQGSTNGFNPDEHIQGPQQPTSGTVDRIVPDGEVFVAGDNRQGKNSLDSRNGMSTVPASELQGNALLRFWPLMKFRFL